jgi:hypothetical protein
MSRKYQLTTKRLLKKLKEAEVRFGAMPFKVFSRREGVEYVHVELEVEQRADGSRALRLVIG